MYTLENKVIISARPASEEDILKKYLTEKGAKVLDFPMIEIFPIEADDKIRTVFERLSSFEWIVFTSRSGAEYFSRTLQNLGIDISYINNAKIAVVGKTTADAVIKLGMKSHLISSGNTSNDLMHEILSEIKCSKHDTKPEILLALGKLASYTLEEGLRDVAEVTRIELYETLEPAAYSKEIFDIIANDNYDIIAFTSPSQVRNFIKITDYNQQESKFACIGKTTEKEVLKYGIKPLIVSKNSDGLSFAKEIERVLSIGYRVSGI